MDLVKKCAQWQQKGEFGKIIKEVGRMPPQLRTPQLNLYLATALCGTSEGWEDREKFRQVLQLCLPHKNVFENNYLWNFNLGYAYSHLGMDRNALRYFEEAAKHQASPGSTIQEYIEQSRNHLQLPRFEVPFKERVKEAWRVFKKEQPAILKLLEGSLNPKDQLELRDRIASFVFTVFNAINMSVEGTQRHMTIILSPGGSFSMLFAIKYLLDRAPKDISEKLSFSIGTAPKENGVMRFDRGQIKQAEIPVLVDKLGDKEYKLTISRKEMRRFFPDRPTTVDMLLYQMIFGALGEIATMNYIKEIEIVDEIKDEKSFPLSYLVPYLISEGIEFDATLSDLLAKEAPYNAIPDNSEDSILRTDIEKGTTRNPELGEDYLLGLEGHLNDLEAAGATAGFIFYFLDPFEGSEKEKAIEEFHQSFVKAIEEGASKDSVQIVGSAKGTKAGYIDFLAWDLKPVLDSAQAFLQQDKSTHAGFHVFRRDGNVIGLYDGEIKNRKAPVN